MVLDINWTGRNFVLSVLIHFDELMHAFRMRSQVVMEFKIGMTIGCVFKNSMFWIPALRFEKLLRGIAAEMPEDGSLADWNPCVDAEPISTKWNLSSHHAGTFPS